MERLSSQEWIAIASHHLSRRWRHVDPAQLDELAAEFLRDDALKGLEPGDAASAWLAPLDTATQSLLASTEVSDAPSD